MDIKLNFLFSIRIGDYPTIIQFLDRGYKIQEDKWHGLEEAILSNQCSICSLLIERGANLQQKGTSCALLAMRKAYYDIFDLFLSHGVKISDVEDAFFSQLVIYENKWSSALVDQIKVFIERGSSIYNEPFILKKAVKDNNMNFLIYLVDKKANIHIENDILFTIARENKHVEIFNYLCANRNPVYNLFISAAAKGHYLMVGVYYSMIKEPGKKLLNDALYIAAKNNHTDVCYQLIEYGAESENAIIGSIGNENIELVQKIITTAKNDVRDKIFLDSVYNMKNRVVEALIDNSADLQVRNLKAFQLAIHKGNLEVIKLLVRKGFDISVDDDYGLRQSCYMGNLELVTCFLNQGANINAKRGEPINTAAKLAHLDLFELLLDRGAKTELLDIFSITFFLKSIDNETKSRIIGRLRKK